MSSTSEAEASGGFCRGTSHALNRRAPNVNPNACSYLQERPRRVVPYQGLHLCRSQGSSSNPQNKLSVDYMQACVLS